MEIRHMASRYKAWARALAPENNGSKNEKRRVNIYTLAHRLCVLTITAAMIGCGGSGEGLDQTGRPVNENPPVDNTPDANFAFLQNSVLTPVCTVCHLGGAAPVGLRLDSANAYDMLVNVESVQVPGVLRVAPGDPDNSYLIQKLEGTAAVGGQMPLGGPPLDGPTIDLFRQWIADGALPIDTSVPSTTPPIVITNSPVSNAVLSSPPSALSAEFSQPMDASLAGPLTFLLRGSGGDGSFDDGNEIAISPSSITLTGGTTINMDVSAATFADDVYEARLVGTGATALADLSGSILDGDSDGVSGGDYAWQFTIDTASSGPEPTWRWIQDNVFTPVCTQCHADGGIASFLMLDELNSFAMTVNRPSNGVPTLDLIEPFDADNSYLIQKLEGTAAVGAQMPLGGDPLDIDVIAAIRSWVSNGALLEPGDPQPDNTAPDITLTAPSSPLSGTVALVANASDDTGVTSVRFYAAGSLVGTDDTAPYEINWDTATFADGAYTLIAEADDASGNTGVSATVSVTVSNALPPDTTAPVVSVVDPGSPLSGTVNLMLSASDDAGVSVARLYIDEGLVATFTTTPFDFSWDTSTLANGDYVLRAEAEDAAGNLGVSTTVNVTVDNGLPPDTEAPVISIDSPAAPVSATVTVSLNASDNSAVTVVRLYVDAVLVGSDSVAPYLIEWDTTGLTDGTHLLSAEAEDAAGNVGFAPTLSVNVENGGPQPTSDWIQSNVFTPICTACHVSGGIASFLLLDDGNSFNMMINVPSSQVMSLDRVEPGLPDMSYLVQKLEGTAAVGSQMPLGGSPLPVETIGAIRQWIADGASVGAVDTLTPVVTLTPPQSTVSGTVTVSVDAVDDVAVSEVRLLANGAVIATDSIAPYTFEWDTTLLADGVYPLVAEADDSSGNTGASQVVMVTVENGVADVEPPLVTIDALAMPVNGAVTVAVNASDNVGVVSVELQVDGVSVGTDTQAPYEIVWDSTSVADGSRNLTAIAVDAAGNAGTSPSLSVTVDNTTPVDTTAPTVALMSLSSPLSGTVLVSATASDDTGVTVVRFYVNDVLSDSDTVAPYEFSWDTTTVVDGSYTLRAEAEDAAGNVGSNTSAVLAVVNSTGPEASWRWIQDNIFSPLCVVCHVAGGPADFLPLDEASSYDQLVNAPTTEGGPLFRVQPGDPDNSSLVQRLEGTLSPQMPLGGAALPPDEIAAVRQWIADGALPEAPTDTTAPQISVVSPGATVSGSITLLVDATDDTAVTMVRFFVDDVLLSSDSAAPFEALWDTTQTSDAEHTLTAEAEDAAGNTTLSSAVTVVVNNTLPPDVIPPSVTIAPIASPVSGLYPVEVTASDDVAVTSVTLGVDGEDVLTDFTAPYIIDWNTFSVSNGPHTLTARASDAAGNTSVSADVTVTVSNTAPIISVSLDAPLSVVDGDDFSVVATISNSGAASDALTATLAFTPADAVRIQDPGPSQAVGPVVNNAAVPAVWLMRADEPGDAVITVTITNASGAVSQQSQVNITVVD